MKLQTHTSSEALERITITVPRELAAAVDNYWHREHLGSRSEAIRRLLEAALAADKKKRGKG
jgi:metal-responsive CopG/Arc/MetJ family transcriptional regulator